MARDKGFGRKKKKKKVATEVAVEVRKSIKTRMAMGQTGRASSNPIKQSARRV